MIDPPRVTEPVPVADRMGLQRRLLLLLLVPLLAIGMLGVWLEYRLADTVAIQQDRQLLTLVPLMADAVQGSTGDGTVALPLPAEVQDFLDSRAGVSGYALLNNDGRLLAGDEWLRDYPPTTYEPEFSSIEMRGVVYRIVSQRVTTRAGELTVRLGDGSNPRLQRLRRLALKVVLPNVLLALAALAAVRWAVRRALRPLLRLRSAVEERSPRDLTPLDTSDAPLEVLPLVQSLNRLFDLVNAQAESQRRFVADAAHQLRTPLAGLQAQVEALAQQAQYASAEPMLALRTAVRRTSQLASQLLTLSRADGPTAAAQPMQVVDLKALCEQLLEHHLDAASARGLDFGLECQAVRVPAHEWLLRELLHNLVDNALRYTPPGGRVTLRCGPWQPAPAGPQANAGGPRSQEASPSPSTTPMACLEVEDNGPGVPVPERSRILQRFYRMPGTPGAGSGLGLAIADEIARVHQSQLQLDSGPDGRGLRVTLVLRAVRE